VNAYKSGEEHVCYGCDGPREINPARSIPGITNYKPCSACGAIGIKRKSDPERARALPSGHLSLGRMF
jgi:hypothetical protein